MRKITALFIFLFYGGNYVAAMELHDVLASIASTTEKFAYFTETRTASFLDRPLVTKGTLEFKAPLNMIKRLEEPEKIEQRIEGDILSISDSTKSVKTVSLLSSPELASGINAVRWILAGNENALVDHFNVTFNNVVYQWTIKLIPRDSEVANVIRTIDVSGEKTHIKQIKITHANGDTVITDLYGNK